jgi:hypothetical protein
MTEEEYKNIIEASESDKEYICNWCKKNFYTEEQADDYALEFLKWCEWKIVLSLSLNAKPTHEKLLEEFKKEKGL